MNGNDVFYRTDDGMSVWFIKNRNIVLFLHFSDQVYVNIGGIKCNIRQIQIIMTYQGSTGYLIR